MFSGLGLNPRAPQGHKRLNRFGWWCAGDGFTRQHGHHVGQGFIGFVIHARIARHFKRHFVTFFQIGFNTGELVGTNGFQPNLL